DVDRAVDGAERALDAALLVEPEHPAEAVARLLHLFGVLLRVGLPTPEERREKVDAGRLQAGEDVEEQYVVEKAHAETSTGAAARAPFSVTGRRMRPRSDQRSAATKRPHRTTPRTRSPLQL